MIISQPKGLIMVLLGIQIVIAFLLGSIPFGILVCSSLGLHSPATYGSKNIGASNVARQNKLAGLLTLLLDAAKGYVAIKICSPNDLIMLAVILGHCYSPLLNFNGGKGIATYGGALIALNPLFAFTLGLVWFFTVLDQAPAVASLIICAITVFYGLISKKYILLATSLIIIYRHKNNVSELQKN